MESYLSSPTLVTLPSESADSFASAKFSSKAKMRIC